MPAGDSPINGSRGTRTALGIACALVVLGWGVALAADKGGPVEKTHDGLELLPDTKVMAAWVSPGADFSGYERVMIEGISVAFRRGWQMDQNRQSVGRVSSRDMQRIKDEAAQMLHDAFAEELSAEGGFEIVDMPESDVLLVKPAIVDLDVTAPEDRGTGRSFNFTRSAGSVTLYLELFDSVSGEILARAVDQRAAETPGNVMRLSSGAANRAEAERVFAGWADLLREGLDELRQAL